ncbi:homeobox protein Hmx-like [Aphis craccivora]|uniref:Homeobox protein Hmx-like n=1 Tax=Aphis craccivora TaxID=307492 RepID=A0A6G0WFN3_APHCR|nr:homeobox protein Hmx-like [Aphis craccivora]
MLMMMDCSNRKPPADLSSGMVVATVSSPELAVAGTWHPHVYGNPPRTPTAHNVADILGWTKSGTDEQPLNLSTAKRPNGTVLDLTKIKRKGKSALAYYYCDNNKAGFITTGLSCRVEYVSQFVGTGNMLPISTY